MPVAGSVETLYATGAGTGSYELVRCHDDAPPIGALSDCAVEANAP